ncbi:hypothetical protein STEG23_003524 [Scotinomys teguina]
MSSGKLQRRACVGLTASMTEDSRRFKQRETSCFWRIKQNEEDAEDLKTDCEFTLFLTPEPIEKDFYNNIINFRLGLFMLSQIFWTLCVMTFLDLVFSLTD